MELKIVIFGLKCPHLILWYLILAPLVVDINKDIYWENALIILCNSKTSNVLGK